MTVYERPFGRYFEEMVLSPCIRSSACCASSFSAAASPAVRHFFTGMREPNIPDRLLGLDNVVLTPHMAAISANAQRAQRALMFANLEAFFAGRPVLTPVPE